MPAAIEHTIRDVQLPLTIKQPPYETAIKEWLRPVINLDKFYVYPIDGITGAINYWLSTEKRTVKRLYGDYEYVNNTGDEVLYMTNPSSIDGNFTRIPTDIPVVLDIAYVGTTNIHTIEVPNNVEKVFFSLSKPFGMQTIRTGWYFTRRPDYKLNRLTRLSNYYNHVAHTCAEVIIGRFGIEYAYNTYKDQQREICDKYMLTPSDSVWLATSTDTQYSEFMRDHNLARLCLTQLF